MNTQKCFSILLVVSALAMSYGNAAHAARKATSEKKALQSNEGCGSLSKKCCARLPQPPVFPEPYGNILEGENCTCCFENRVLPLKTDLNDNKVCLSYEELCKSLCTPLTYPGVPVPPSYTPDPAVVVPPCQKDIYPPEVPNPLNIRGKNVLVIGGSKGNGKAIAERFADPRVGCNVIATSRHPECYEKPVGYSLQKVDVRFEEDVRSFIEHAVGKCFNGRLDILVNCAAVYWAGSLALATGDDLLQILNNNVAGYHRVTHYALPYMRHNNETRVISFGSLAAYAVAPAFGGYGITKAAIPKWNDTMQIEEMFNKAQGFQQFGPTFTCVEPGVLLTSIGLYEWYQASTLSLQDPLVQGPHMAFAGPQNIADFGAAPTSIVSEAVFRIAVSPLPGVRYTAVAENDPIMALQLVAESNRLSQDEAINQVWVPWYTPLVNSVQVFRAALQEAYCEGCSAGDSKRASDKVKAQWFEKIRAIVSAAGKKAGAGCASDGKLKS
jgi:NAD(P)-dependent dehydrogenase (short-subunit alcohol dehydrogenase family)